MKTIWQAKLAETAAKYGEHAPTAAVCCNTCRTCVQTNLLGLGMAGIVAATGGVMHVAKRIARRS